MARSEEPKLLLGAVIPDVVEVSFGRVAKKMALRPRDFLDWVVKNYPEWKNLGLGVMSHCQRSGGADSYSDGKAGFAIKLSKELKPEIEKRFGWRKNSIIFGHTLVEIAIDLNLTEDNPKLWQVYKKMWQESGVSEAAAIIAEFSGDSTQEVDTEIRKIRTVFRRGSYKLANWVTGFGWWPAMERGRLLKAIGLVSEIRKIVRNDYLNWLDGAAEGMRRDLILSPRRKNL
jgi:hypothetical protein